MVIDCGVYESQCFSSIAPVCTCSFSMSLLAKKIVWTFSGYEESVPSFLQLNVTYHNNKSCNGTMQLLHLSYTWFVSSITNNWQDWEVTGNNIFIKVLSDDTANKLQCDKGVIVQKEVMSVQYCTSFTCNA